MNPLQYTFYLSRIDNFVECPTQILCKILLELVLWTLYIIQQLKAIVINNKRSQQKVSIVYFLR